MTGDLLARGFLALAVLSAAGIAGLAALPAAAGGGADVAYDPGVPTDYAFADIETPGVATVDGRAYDSFQLAVDDAPPGATVELEGRFDERVTVTTPNLTLESPPGVLAVVDGGGEGDTLTVAAPGVTVRRVWVRNSGYDTAADDSAILVGAADVSVVDSRVTDATFGIWIDGVRGATVRNTTVVGRESVTPRSYRGNGVQMWKAEDSLIVDNRITDARDGIYYSWASNVTARNNTLWDLRYGVHYMYSDRCRLEANTAFDNDVGFALMLSERIRVTNNTAVDNAGTSGHGILLKRIDHSVVTGNAVIDNRNGLFVFNSVDDTLADNLVLANRVGVHHTAGSEGERVYGNSFIDNDRAVVALVGERVAWNASGRGNYWAAASPSDVDGDGVNEVRHRPAGVVEHLVHEHPQAAVFAASPTFDAIRRAESAFPVVDAPGVVDHHPLAEPPHDDWRHYYERD